VVVEKLAAELLTLSRDRLRLAVDGPDAAGKTTFADALAATAGAARIRADDFLNAPEVRMRRGQLSPEGCYRDSFDHDALRAAVASAAGWVVVDGVFLLRPELADLWDVRVYLHVPPEVTLQRALARDAVLMGGADEVLRRYRARYLPAQELYRAEADPTGRAHVVLDNSAPAQPTVLRWDLAG
jgi:uridine kinase